MGNLKTGESRCVPGWQGADGSCLLLGKDIWGSVTRRPCLPTGENVTVKIHRWQLPGSRALEYLFPLFLISHMTVVLWGRSNTHQESSRQMNLSATRTQRNVSQIPNLSPCRGQVGAAGGLFPPSSHRPHPLPASRRAAGPSSAGCSAPCTPYGRCSATRRGRGGEPQAPLPSTAHLFRDGEGDRRMSPAGPAGKHLTEQPYTTSKCFGHQPGWMLGAACKRAGMPLPF